MAKRFRRAQSVTVYRVGGSVRDELLGRAVSDRDWVVVGATPEMLIASGYKPVGRDFPVFLHPETREEYALARTERKHGRGYRGFEFFVSPDVSLEEDLERRDLTINAMARDEQGTLIDPFGGARDLDARVLRHVSPAFAEDPLRALRVARFAARFDFEVAPETKALMKTIVASGELVELAPERVWQELARGLMEGHPSKMFAVLRDCGALAELMPEVNALFAAPRRGAPRSEVDAGARTMQALDYAAAKGFDLPVRYAVLTHDLAKTGSPGSASSKQRGGTASRVRLASRLSARLKAPAECREAAMLAARWAARVHQAPELRPAMLLDLLSAADALRRPSRLDRLLEICESDASSRAGADATDGPAEVVRDAFRVVKRVDAAAIARELQSKGGRRESDKSAEAIGKAVRGARLKALADWRRARGKGS